MRRRKLPRVTRAITRAGAENARVALCSLRYTLKRWKRIDEKQRALLLAWSEHAVGAIDQLIKIVREVNKATTPKSPWLHTYATSEPEKPDV